MSSKCVRINNIICSGNFERRKEENCKKTSTTIHFWGNKIKLRKNTFTAFITKNIHFLFVENDFYKLIKKRIKEEIQDKIIKFKVDITNIHHNITLNIDQGFLLKEFLPKLKEIGNVEKVSITQEKDCSFDILIEELTKAKELAFINLVLYCCSKKVTLKVQYNQKQKITHLTIITSSLAPIVLNLIEFIESFA